MQEKVLIAVSFGSSRSGNDEPYSHYHYFVFFSHPDLWLWICMLICLLQKLSATQDLNCSKMWIHKLTIKIPWHLESQSASGPHDSSQKSQQDLWPGLHVQCLMQQSPDCSGSGRVALGDDEFFQRRCLGRHIHASWIQQIQAGGGRRLITQGKVVWVWNYWDVPSMVIGDLQITRKVSSSGWVQQS